jgi:2C-methyl-D-erythritol 2,4-cyclodiphosphate synthase
MALPILVTHDANLASSDALDTIAETVSDIGKVFDTITTTYMDQIVNLLENIEKNLQSATDDIHNLLHTGIQQTLKTNNKLYDMFEKMLTELNLANKIQ